MPALLRPRPGLLLLAALSTAGCQSSVGPDTIARDRFDYSAALGDSWKHQTLLNLVKLRYMDLPIFLDVGQIVSGYALETGVNLGATVSSPKAIQGDFLALGASARFTDRPTITYTPMTGDRFLRNMLDPLPPSALFRMVQSGYAADRLFELTVESFNGLRNRAATIGMQSAEPRFLRALELLRAIQASSAMGMRLDTSEDGSSATVVFFRRPDGDSELAGKIGELVDLLGLDASAPKFELIYSPVQGEAHQLAVRTRSLLQLLLTLASYVDVPQADIDAGRATPAPPLEAGRVPMLHIHSGSSAPASAFFAVPYRDLWFWIEDADLSSKRTFSFLMFLFTLADTGGERGAPILTIPTSG
jgi:hypothetical protein